MEKKEDKIIAQFTSYGLIAGVVIGAINDNVGLWIAIGVAIGAADAAKMVTVQTDGIAMVKAGAAVAQGAVVTSADDGEAVTATTGDYQHGYALEAASGAGEIISVLLKPAGIAA